MSNFLKNLPVYQPNGTPAYAWVQIPTGLLPGDFITINGDVYAFGTDFFGQSAAQQLRSLVNAIRADHCDAQDVAPTNTGFFRSYYANFSGNYCVLFCVVPGPAGNAFTLASSTSRIVISGGNFTGGLTGNVDSSGGLQDASGTIVTGGTPQTGLAVNTNRKYLFISNLSADILWVNFSAEAAITTPGSIPILQNGALAYESGYIPTDGIRVISATTGNKYTIKWA